MGEEDITSIDSIRDLRNRHPFIPFVIVMTSGDRFVIENGDALAMTSSQLHYFPPRTDRAVRMRVSQIAFVESPATQTKES